MQAELEAYQAELRSLSDHELEKRVDSELEKEERALKVSEERERFFNQPRAQAAFGYWARLPLWNF